MHQLWQMAKVQMSEVWIASYDEKDQRKFMNIELSEKATTVLNPETYGFRKVWQIKLGIDSDAQHDGRLWNEEDVERNEDAMFDEIMKEMSSVVRGLIKKSDPFAMHKGI